jgi:hypothetical protein
MSLGNKEKGRALQHALLASDLHFGFTSPRLLQPGISVDFHRVDFCRDVACNAFRR